MQFNDAIVIIVDVYTVLCFIYSLPILFIFFIFEPWWIPATHFYVYFCIGPETSLLAIGPNSL